jgi:hypothetical protein
VLLQVKVALISFDFSFKKLLKGEKRVEMQDKKGRKRGENRVKKWPKGIKIGVG